MKRVVLGLLIAAAPVFAGPFNKSRVPEGAEWVLHLDAEAFGKTKLGATVIDEKLESHVKKAEGDTKQDFSFSFKTVKGATIFGMGAGKDDEAVLVLETPADLKSDLSKLIALKEAGTSGEPPVSKLADGGADIYLLGKDVYLMGGKGDVWLLGKHKPSLEVARKVVSGEAPALTKAEFLNFPAVENAFFFLAAADTGSAASKLPAQAKILQNAQAGRIVIGEHGEKLFLNLALRAKDVETLNQIGEVLRGLKALVALANSEDKDLTALVNSAAITSNENVLMVNLSFPVGRAIEKSRED